MKNIIFTLSLIFLVEISYGENKNPLNNTTVESQSFDKKSSWSIITTNMFDDTFYKISTYKVVRCKQATAQWTMK